MRAPWGSRQPEPYFDHTDKIYMLALQEGAAVAVSSRPTNCIPTRRTSPPRRPPTPPSPAEAAKPAEAKVEKVEIDLDGIAARLEEVPVPAGNYADLAVAGKRLCWLDRNAEDREKSVAPVPGHRQQGRQAGHPDGRRERLRSIGGRQEDADCRKQNELLLWIATVKGAALKDPKTLADSQVDLKTWTFSVIPGDEFREAFLDAWRLHRDYFYDPNMHGVDWAAMREKYGGTGGAACATARN